MQRLPLRRRQHQAVKVAVDDISALNFTSNSASIGALRLRLRQVRGSCGRLA
ncbi:MAG: hypothetical protein ABI575_08235 [Oxalobacteraceae bacterium]